MYMGRSLTAFWDEGELGNSVMLFLLVPVVVAVFPNVPYRLNAQLGILVTKKLQLYLQNLRNSFCVSIISTYPVSRLTNFSSDCHGRGG